MEIPIRCPGRAGEHAAGRDGGRTLRRQRGWQRSTFNHGCAFMIRAARCCLAVRAAVVVWQAEQPVKRPRIVPPRLALVPTPPPGPPPQWLLAGAEPSPEYNAFEEDKAIERSIVNAAFVWHISSLFVSRSHHSRRHP